MGFWNSVRSFFSSSVPQQLVPSVIEKDNEVKNVVVSGPMQYQGYSGRKGIEEFSSIDLDEIRRAYHSDSYIRQAIDKYTDLMFKAGFYFKGKNPKSVAYLKQRLHFIADSTGVPLQVLLQGMAHDLVLYHNIFMVKVRRFLKDIPVKVRPAFGYKQPIAAYFLMHPASVRIVRDEHGNVLEYKQYPFGNKYLTSTNAQYPNFGHDEVIHIYKDKESGVAFGVPYISPALGDIKILRGMEDNVSRLVYRMTFPFTQVKVGENKEGMGAHEEEIDYYTELIKTVPIDATLVTSERVSFNIQGVEGKALKVSDYLKHFERRGFTGLAVSDIAMGRSDTSNRSTSDTLTTEMHDKVESYQNTLKVFFEDFVIKELLAEGGYNVFFNPDDMAYLEFKEIELESVIKMQNNIVFKYEHNAITEDEMRIELGEEPIDVKQRERMYNALVKIPIIKAMAEARGLGVGVNPIPDTKDVDNKNKPQNQHGTRLAPKIKEVAEKMEDKDLEGAIQEVLQKYLLYLGAIEEIINSKLTVSSHQDRERKVSEIKFFVRMEASDLKLSINKYTEEVFKEGALTAARDASFRDSATILFSYKYTYINDLYAFSDKCVDKLCRDILKAISDSSDLNKALEDCKSFGYRIKFLVDQQIKQAYYFGYLNMATWLNKKVENVSNEHCCEECSKLEGHVKHLSIYSVPAHHPGCKCYLRMLFGDK